LKQFILFLLVPILFSCSSNNIKNNDKELKGFYLYMADAPVFYDCETDKKYPIAFEGDSIELEKAYLAVVEIYGKKILVTLLGKYELRDKVEGLGKEEFLVITKFLNIWPNIDCNTNLGTANLINTFWKLNQLNGNTIYFNAVKDMHFLIEPSYKIKGFAGCNNFFGSISLANNSIKFNLVGNTLKMCNDNIEIENEFLTALQNVNKYIIYGEFLYLYGNSGLIAKFESVYFN